MPQVSTWPTDGLHAKLCDIMPAYRTRRGAFDVPRLSLEMGKSPEAVYKWLREDDLKTMDNVRTIVCLAAQGDNLAELQRLDRTPPEITDLLRFVN